MDHPVPPDPPLPPAAIAALHLGRTIEAIKIVRELHGLGLKEAKDRVDRYVAADPLLSRKLGAGGAPGLRGCLLVLAALVLLGGLLLFLTFTARP